MVRPTESKISITVAGAWKELKLNGKRKEMQRKLFADCLLEILARGKWETRSCIGIVEFQEILKVIYSFDFLDQMVRCRLYRS